ncbi:MAG TPA: ankyrin repeat domain-containing protein [Thermoanaerobaculia bacterium]|jgi:hypothetical protein|nr:ankyrin repeat domain-containing protein [Thermoanaerobaculia bacterium]
MAEPSTSKHHNPLESDTAELRKLDLEIRRLEQDKELKEKELEIQRGQAARGPWGAPVIAALIAGIVGLLGTFWSSYQSREIERQKQEGTLILEAIKTGTGETKQAAGNLLFLDKLGLLRLSNEQRAQLENVAGSRNPLPSLPTEAKSAKLEPTLWGCIPPAYRPTGALSVIKPNASQLTEGLLTMVLMGELDCVELLMKSGADVNAVRVPPEDSFGDGPPLHAALNQGHWEIARFLLSKNADPNELTS